MKTIKLGQIESKLHEKDWILLRALQTDARTSFAELGRRTRMSAPAAAERARRLEDDGVIRGYHARVDPVHLGLQLQVFIQMNVKRVDYARFRKAVTDLSWILECHHIAGQASFLLRAAVPDNVGLEQLIGHLSQFGDTTTSLVLSTALERREF